MGTKGAGPPATVADRYELGDLLGVGGMGQVWEAQDVRLRRRVVVKLLNPHLAGDDAVRRRFEIEARAAARLGHPNVVSVFDVGEQDGRPFIVMERLSGPTLAEVLRHGPLDPDEARAMAGDVLAGLAAVHAAGVVHRDVKPGNVMRGADGRWKLTDFGIATAGDEPTDPGQRFGTPAYLAPEVRAGGPSTPRSDVYAAGVLLHEALTGSPPAAQRPPLVARGRAVPPALADAVDRALAADPAERFPSAAEMQAALHHDDATRALAVVPTGSPGPRRPARAAVVIAGVLIAGLAIFAFIMVASPAGDDVPDTPQVTVAATDPPPPDRPVGEGGKEGKDDERDAEKDEKDEKDEPDEDDDGSGGRGRR